MGKHLFVLGGGGGGGGVGEYFYIIIWILRFILLIQNSIDDFDHWGSTVLNNLQQENDIYICMKQQ